MDEGYIDVSNEEAAILISFIKAHDREDIPDDVWDVCKVIMHRLNIE